MAIFWEPKHIREYLLVVELKRPKKKIDLEVISQIKRYANAVTKDERFHDTKTRWVFMTVSNQMTDDAHLDANAPDRPKGIVGFLPNGISIWAKSWGQIIQDAKGRLEFFKQPLEYEADSESARSYLLVSGGSRRVGLRGPVCQGLVLDGAVFFVGRKLDRSLTQHGFF